MNTSVVLCTYNGEKYIYDQMISILSQTTPVDTVYIIDDASSDSTVDIINKFISEHRISNWTLTVNEKNKGWRVNFWDAINRNTSDLIFLCDQDDIWHNDKVEIMKEMADRNPDALLITSNYEPIYEGNVQKIRRSYSNIDHADYLKKIEFSEKFSYVRRPGCTYVIRRELIEISNQIWKPSYAHDWILWVTALTLGKAYASNLQLMQFRRYSSSATAVKKTKVLDKAIRHKASILDHRAVDHIDVCENLLKITDNKEIVNKINYYKNFSTARLNAYKNKSIFSMIYIGIRYNKCYLNKATFFMDIFCQLI